MQSNRLASHANRTTQAAMIAALALLPLFSGADQSAYWYVSRIALSCGALAMEMPVYDIGKAAPSAENAWGEGARAQTKFFTTAYGASKPKGDVVVSLTVGVVNPNRRPKVEIPVPMADLEIGGETTTATAEGWQEGNPPLDYPRDSQPKFTKFVATIPAAKAGAVLKALSSAKTAPTLALGIENAVCFGSEGDEGTAPAVAAAPAPAPVPAPAPAAAPAPVPADAVLDTELPWATRYALARASGEKISPETMRDAIDNGVVDAMLDLAAAYEKGDGVKVNPAESAKLYRRAAEAGSQEGGLRYAVALLDGKGVPKSDPVGAVAFLEPAADAGLADAQFLLGMCRFDGFGDASLVDKDAAFTLFKKAAARSSRASTMLGYCYLNGIGTKQSNRSAFDAFRSAAKRGAADAQLWTAYCLATGTGVRERNLEAARGYAAQAAEQQLAGADDLLAAIDKALGTTPEEK